MQDAILIVAGSIGAAMMVVAAFVWRSNKPIRHRILVVGGYMALVAFGWDKIQSSGLLPWIVLSSIGWMALFELSWRLRKVL